jgi:hypothetical protein
MTAYDCIRERDGIAVPLKPNDYIYSPSRLYCAVVEANGQFNIYSGENPNDPGKVKVWSTDSPGPLPSGAEITLLISRLKPEIKQIGLWAHRHGKPAYSRELWASGGSEDMNSPMEGRLQDDGRLVLRQLQRGIWNEKWNNGVSDPVVEYTGVMEYDLKNGKHKPKGPPKRAYRLTAFNDTTDSQKATVNVSCSKAKATGWKVSESLKIGASFKAKATIPLIGAEGELTTSVELTTVFEWNETKTTTETETVIVDCNVSPGKTVMAQATWQEETLSVPFTVKGTVAFRSGRTAPYRFSGMYEGIQGLDISTSWINISKGQENQAREMLSKMPGTPVP